MAIKVSDTTRNPWILLRTDPGGGETWVSYDGKQAKYVWRGVETDALSGHESWALGNAMTEKHRSKPRRKLCPKRKNRNV